MEQVGTKGRVARSLFPDLLRIRRVLLQNLDHRRLRHPLDGQVGGECEPVGHLGREGRLQLVVLGRQRPQLELDVQVVDAQPGGQGNDQVQPVDCKGDKRW